jgi:hypothetical protein
MVCHFLVSFFFHVDILLLTRESIQLVTPVQAHVLLIDRVVRSITAKKKDLDCITRNNVLQYGQHRQNERKKRKTAMTEKTLYILY